MPQLPLRTRRQIARGFNRRHVAVWRTRRFIGIGNRATLTTAMSGTNNDLLLIARTPGTDGNSIRFRVVVSGANTGASVAVSGNDITFNSATSAGSAATSTANEAVRALQASAPAMALIWPAVEPHSDGTGVVAALAYTNLSGAA